MAFEKITKFLLIAGSIAIILLLIQEGRKSGVESFREKKLALLKEDFIFINSKIESFGESDFDVDYFWYVYFQIYLNDYDFFTKTKSKFQDKTDSIPSDPLNLKKVLYAGAITKYEDQPEALFFHFKGVVVNVIPLGPEKIEVFSSLPAYSAEVARFRSDIEIDD